ncbi:ICMT-domain-containing protein [Fistulina hepatica ATCC 64428]|nr:ICMT-domain-containing protein [Fistulina hepatica ATCC 64428]
MKPVVGNEPHGNIPNTPLSVSAIAFLLGGVFFLGLATVALNHFWWRLGFFISAWSFFHWVEFAVTAGWNLEKCSVDSYLLDNGYMYHLANTIGLTEYLVTLYFAPQLKSWSYISDAGILVVLFGQALRSMAMIHASTNFSHTIAYQKRSNHKLVTDGVYAYSRHPSYAGFFYWALGTQFVLQNPVTFFAYLFLLWRFFYQRTKVEERLLVKFFGQEYEDYRKRVGTCIPFVP